MQLGLERIVHSRYLKVPTHKKSVKMTEMSTSAYEEDAVSLVPLPQQSNKLRQGFIKLAEALLESIADVFPECENTASVLSIFRSIIKGNDAFEDKFIRRCYTLFKEHSVGVKNHDCESLFTIMDSLDHLRDMDLREKWEDPDFLPESREHLWQYVTALKTYADLYAAVPKNVMGKIESVAGELGDQLARGKLDLKNMDISAIGQNLLSDLTPEELTNFEGNLPEIYESLSHVAGTMGSGQGANLDIASLMQQLSQQTGETLVSGGGADCAQQSANVDMSKIFQTVATQMPGRVDGVGGNVDMAQMMQALGPLMSAIGTIPGASTSTGTSVNTPAIQPRDQLPQRGRSSRSRQN